jgi:hypothetical protein
MSALQVKGARTQVANLDRCLLTKTLFEFDPPALEASTVGVAAAPVRLVHLSRFHNREYGRGSAFDNPTFRA